MKRFDVYVPEGLSDALAYLEKNPDALPLAAGTDLLNRIRRGQVKARTLVDLSGLEELRYISREKGVVRIGALTTIEDLASSGLADGPLAGLRQLCEKFGAPQIRNVATVGGSICAASSADDLIPLMLALGARVKIVGPQGERAERLEEFLVDKRLVDLRPGEILAEVAFDEPPPSSHVAFEKVGMRGSLIIAFVSLGLYLEMERAGGIVADVRMAFNRVKGRIPERAKETERFLKGKRYDADLVSGALEVLDKELRLTSDYRASGYYRREAAKAIAKRALEHSAGKIMEAGAYV